MKQLKYNSDVSDVLLTLNAVGIQRRYRNQYSQIIKELKIGFVLPLDKWEGLAPALIQPVLPPSGHLEMCRFIFQCCSGEEGKSL